MLVIDGGFSKAINLRQVSQVTLLYNSFGMQLVAHQFFDSKENVLSDGADELSVRRVVDEELQRKIRDTNVGKDIMEQIRMLKLLMHDRYLK